MSNFDPKRVEEAIAEHKCQLLDALESAVGSTLGNLTPSEALTIRLVSGESTLRRIAPGATIEYARALLAFMRQREFNGCEVDSAVTPVVLDVVEKQVIAFYSSHDVTEAIIAGIVEQVHGMSDPTDAIRSEIRENLDWLRKEYTALTVDSSYSLAGTLIDVSAHHIQEFLSSATGKVIVAGIVKAMSTTWGKIALQRLLTAVIQKVMASAALKSAILTTIKKVGIGILIKTAIGKALVALLAAVGIAHVPIAWVILPIIGVFLAHEYFTFPRKLAERVPSAIRNAMNDRFGELNERITLAATHAIFTMLEREITKVRIPREGEQNVIESQS